MATTKESQKTFKAMLNLCYTEEDFTELHRELLSLESETKISKDPQKYEIAMREILNIIPVFAEDFPLETFSQIENIYQEYLES